MFQLASGLKFYRVIWSLSWTTRSGKSECEDCGCEIPAGWRWCLKCAAKHTDDGWHW